MNCAVTYGRVELRPTKAPPFFSQGRRISVAKPIPVFSENPACESIVGNPTPWIRTKRSPSLSSLLIHVEPQAIILEEGQPP
jgi:hypothetical protein